MQSCNVMDWNTLLMVPARKHYVYCTSGRSGIYNKPWGHRKWLVLICISPEYYSHSHDSSALQINRNILIQSGLHEEPSHARCGGQVKQIEREESSLITSRRCWACFRLPCAETNMGSLQLYLFKTAIIIRLFAYHQELKIRLMLKS